MSAEVNAIRILIGCECSGRIRTEFRNLGFDAWSCDLKPAEDGSNFHIQGNILDVLDRPWDGAIFHPDCTYLCNSGVRWLYADSLDLRPYGKFRDKNWDRMNKMEEAAAFFLRLWNCRIPSVAIENPVMHGHAKKIIGIQQSQVVQPWMFGDGEIKATCWWLRGFPLLGADNVVEGRTPRVHHASPGPERKTERSRTPKGMARAIAEQWGDYLLQNREDCAQVSS